MADNALLDMSLEDLINAKKKENRGARRDGGGRSDKPKGGRDGKPRGVAVGGGRKGGAGGRSVVAVNRPQGGVRKSSAPRSNLAPPRTKADLEALDGGGKWRHDLFHQAAAPAPRPQAPAGNMNAIFISNLGDEVSEDDLKELFSSMGELVSCKMRADKSGRFIGLADVIFKQAADAKAAFDKYKSAKLDGRPMVLELKSTGPAPASGIAARLSGVRSGSGGGDRRDGGRRDGGRRSGGRRDGHDDRMMD